MLHENNMKTTFHKLAIFSTNLKIAVDKRTKLFINISVVFNVIATDKNKIVQYVSTLN